MTSSAAPVLPIAEPARRRYALDRLLPDDAVASWLDLARVREVVEAMTAVDGEGPSAGELLALGLISDALHRLIERYRVDRRDDVIARALDYLASQHGEDTVDRMLERFVTRFPPAPIRAGELDVDTYLEQDEDGVSNRERVFESLLLLYLINDNPAFAPVWPLLDDRALDAETDYREIVSSLETFFHDEPGWGPAAESFWDTIRRPIDDAAPTLGEQLQVVLDVERELPTPPSPPSGDAHSEAAPDPVLPLLRGMDVLREEERGPVVFGPPPPPPVLAFDPIREGEARFSADRGWMPDLVLVAKNTYVWLDQLSQTYDETVERLDDIPDAELARLAELGFTGLWLIGIWRRSEASARIKQRTGNPEAAPSAYAVFDYQIDEGLGGEAAWEDLRDRAATHGIRLACDMVPNHMGIASSWVRDHPERFVSVETSPFPGYSFTGPDLSDDESVSIYLEDGYYDRSDAAVVFKRVERAVNDGDEAEDEVGGDAGDVRYLYHGNDGTGMPWNDTAQLDYLNPETREAVIETILDVARRFPVIRFDAAMTLARRHVRRLWYPAPGTAGDIPSRAEHAMLDDAFDARMPDEFWREVVDRVAEEAPDTLLLAEAFWLMESYFVRHLGMHRVYNSAFMHMLRDEDNAKFRASLINTLAFDPAILGRFVNFLTTPDEDPAAEQFGTGDKYFGVATLMCTLPGLPMFGHGQVEGLLEKYGMEYRRAYRDEQPDDRLEARHKRELVPVLRRRAVFAGVEHFRLFSVTDPTGTVLDDVLAFTNGVERDGTIERALVLFHNRDGWVRGRLLESEPWRLTSSTLEEPEPDDAPADVDGSKSAEPVTGLEAAILVAETIVIEALFPSPSGSSERDTPEIEESSDIDHGDLEPDHTKVKAQKPVLVRESLLEALDIEPAAERLVRWHDLTRGLDFLLPSQHLARNGFLLELGPYEHRVLVDFESIDDALDGPWQDLAARLHGHGVPDLDTALEDLRVQPVVAPVRELMRADVWIGLFRAVRDRRVHLLDEFEHRWIEVLREVAPLFVDVVEPVDVDSEEVVSPDEAPPGETRADGEATRPDPASLVAATGRARLETLLELAAASTAEIDEATEITEPSEASTPPEAPSDPVHETLDDDDEDVPTSAAPSATSPLGEPTTEPAWYARGVATLFADLGALVGTPSSALVTTWRLGTVIESLLLELEVEPGLALQLADAASLEIARPTVVAPVASTLTAHSIAATWVDAWLEDDALYRFLQVHEFDEVLWFNREAFGILSWWWALSARLEAGMSVAGVGSVLDALAAAEQESDYRLDRLLAGLIPPPDPAEPPSKTP
ncbi:MAG: alpha-amylase family glycosyl hydrolase [Acidobacteriota bacterium]